MNEKVRKTQILYLVKKKTVKCKNVLSHYISTCMYFEFFFLCFIGKEINNHEDPVTYDHKVFKIKMCSSVLGILLYHWFS